jgi:four helix bundle protein
MGEEKITSFTKLDAWKEGHKLVVSIYKISKAFPKDELFALTSQIRRAAVSITSNIAEGFSRNSWKEKVQFYSTAMGSLTEVENQLLVARDVGYLSINEFNALVPQCIRVSKLIRGLTRKAKSMC